MFICQYVFYCSYLLLVCRFQTASFEFRGIDKYSRVLGILYFDDTNINQKLIDEKYCKVYKYKEK
ncbi:MAG: thermonuclease family protein [Cyanobacteria bacterium SIG27]|nr:thermonuclease family protein [Cyanobacteria bacterium SIG27]